MYPIHYFWGVHNTDWEKRQTLQDMSSFSWLQISGRNTTILISWNHHLLEHPHSLCSTVQNSLFLLDCMMNMIGLGGLLGSPSSVYNLPIKLGKVCWYWTRPLSKDVDIIYGKDGKQREIYIVKLRLAL